MRTIAAAVACSFLALSTASVVRAAPATGGVAAALADPGRPAEDSARDAARKPADMVAFAGIHAGSKVADFIPGGGYFTRVFAKVVGPNGRVYAFVPSAAADMHNARGDIEGLVKAYPNVVAAIYPLDKPAFPEPLDVVWTAQNYHDFYNFGPGVAAMFNKAAFDALKPGGAYVIVDHVAAAGSGSKDTNTLHRIDPAFIKSEVEAAGFKFDGESPVLRNPADPHTDNVFKPSIRGHTDQVVYRFRKRG